MRLGSFTYLHEILDQRIIDLTIHGGKDTSLSYGSIQNLLDSDRARYTN